ncbi:MAG: hypothetical protein ACREP6_05080 [Candidatus Binataceae bacterium]
MEQRGITASGKSPALEIAQSSEHGVDVAGMLTATADKSLSADSRSEQRRNDAFSFWKLPEDWRAPLETENAASEPVARRYLFEEYLDEDGRRPPSSLSAYYRVKGFIPPSLRHRINSMAIRARRVQEFPRWPCESALLEFWRGWIKQALETLGADDGWHIAFWPGGKSCCIVLTHDVESPVGLSRMEGMADIEERYGFRSVWNLPLAQYPIDWKIVERMRARGFEFGAHGLSHDGKLFRSRADFDELAPRIERIAADHGLFGFRAPSTLRRADWIGGMAFEFDSSFSDTDPYEPQPGGTCSLFPFFLSELIELPYTLPQDHTLIHLLRRSPLPVWTVKARWIEMLGGMILTLTHPDYCGIGPYLSGYEELLKRLSEIDSAWRALPSDVARWWRRRAELNLWIKNGTPIIEGLNCGGAAAVRLSAEPLAGLK